MCLMHKFWYKNGVYEAIFSFIFALQICNNCTPHFSKMSLYVFHPGRSWVQIQSLPLSFYNLWLNESITKFEKFGLKFCTPHFSKRSGACMFFTQEGHGYKFSHCLNLCNSHGPQNFNLKCSNLVIDSLNPKLFSFIS